MLRSGPEQALFEGFANPSRSSLNRVGLGGQRRSLAVADAELQQRVELGGRFDPFGDDRHVPFRREGDRRGGERPAFPDPFRRRG